MHNQEVVLDSDLVEVGRLILDQAKTPRELIVVMKHWVLMRQDLLSGRYAKGAEHRSQVKNIPDPVKLYKHLAETGREDLTFGMDAVFAGAIAADKQSENSLTHLIEEARQRFLSMNPNQEEIALLREQVPEMAV
jgi:hypothetical protein